MGRYPSGPQSVYLRGIAVGHIGQGRITATVTTTPRLNKSLAIE
jgi:hypothetical protein